ncbi:MAG: response regulator [Methanothrix sp.]
MLGYAALSLESDKMWKPNLLNGISLSSKKNEGYTGVFKQPPSPTSGQASICTDVENCLSFHTALVIAAVIIILYLGIWYIVRDNPSGYTIFSNLGYILINVMSILCLFYAAHCSRRFNKRFFISWMILAIAQLSYALADTIYAYYEIVLNESPYPSLADGPYLLRYILFIIGILILPSVRISSRERLKIVLDMAIVMIASLLLFWTLIIAPTIEQNIDADPLTLVLSVAYPVMDLMMLFALADLLFRRLEFSTQRAITLIAASTFLLVFADSVFNIEQLNGTYGAGGGIVDIGWPLAYILIGLAGLSYSDSLKRGIVLPNLETENHYGRITWPLYLPYLCAGGAYVLLIMSRDHPLPLSFSALSWAVGAIIALVITRQVLALKENISLYNEAQQEIAERKTAEKEITRLNEELEHRVAKRTFELETTNNDLEKEIVERKDAENALKDSEQRLADIINFLPDATFVIDKEGAVIAWNHAIESLTGVKANDILGKGSFEYSLPFYSERRPMLIDLVLKSYPEFEKKYNNIINQEDGSLVGETYIPNLKNGALYLVASAAVLYDLEGNIYGAIESMRDITERKLYEENLKSAKERAEAATRAKSEFLANMSHEIRTPMNAVIGMTGLLMDTDLKPEQRDYLETIRDSGNGLLAIINDILDFSKIDGGKMVLDSHAFDLSMCIQTSMDLVSTKAAEKKLELAYLIDDNVPHMMFGDATRLRQILINLLGNAVKFTDKGDVILSVSSSPVGSEKTEIRFAIKDTGIGISKENLSKLFQSFTQVDSSTTRYYGGTGLGLAISKRLVELMGGKIWVESEFGKGSTFYFTVITETTKSNEASMPLHSGLVGKNVFIVEGNGAVRTMLIKAVQSWGMKATASACGEEAIDILGRNVFDFVILDEILPDKDGPTLAREIKNGRNSEAVLIMIRAMGHGVPQETSVSGWLTKPIKPLHLRNLLIERVSEQMGSVAMATNDLTVAIRDAENHNLRILLAEDNLVNQKVALSMLKRLGYQADMAFNGLEVLHALERMTYDVILMDIQMPEMDGFEATRCIRDRRKPAKQPCIIAMTAYALDGDREDCLRAGMDGYISKPINIEVLRKAIEKCRTAHNLN